MRPRLTPYRFAWALAAAFALLLLYLMTACGRVQYIPVQTVMKDSIRLVHVNVDTVIYKDSIFIDRSRDTVYKYVEKVRYEYIFRTDTCSIIETDTVRVPYPVERQLGKWETVRMELGTVFIVLCFAAVAYIIVWIVRRKGMS
ncbi:MAG: hypothetical protein ACI30I_09010 [Parabacteroides sp.]